jgi:hypothetical protein
MATENSSAGTSLAARVGRVDFRVAGGVDFGESENRRFLTIQGYHKMKNALGRTPTLWRLHRGFGVGVRVAILGQFAAIAPCAIRESRSPTSPGCFAWCSQPFRVASVAAHFPAIRAAGPLHLDGTRPKRSTRRRREWRAAGARELRCRTSGDTKGVACDRAQCA